MKFIADENIGFEVVYPLRDLGFDIKSILETARGSEDTIVFSLANKEDRILITTDKDFGELAFANKLVHKGVILLRLRKDSSVNKLKALKNLFAKHKSELEGSFTVVKEGNIRISPQKKSHD